MKARLRKKLEKQAQLAVVDAMIALGLVGLTRSLIPRGLDPRSLMIQAELMPAIHAAERDANLALSHATKLLRRARIRVPAMEAR